ncbi:MAG: MMPL family transporter [Rhodothermales bacterium]|nr:MMPL family transporter [Rhodothermales bacterium]
MKITNAAIKYRTSVFVLTIILVIAGLGTYITIPKESFPSIEIPNIVVTTVYPGASPDDIESLLTQPIEQEVQSVNGIKEIRSSSTEGVSTIIIEFDPDVSIDDALQKTRERVDLAKPDLPSDAEEPIISEIDFADFPVLVVNLAANYSLTRLKEVADDLKDELESISSVLEVDLIGALEREVQINVNLAALQGYNLTFSDIVETIAQENSNIPGGSVDVDRLNYLVRVDGEFNDPSEIEDLVVDSPDGRPIYIRDLAEVVFGFKERTTFARLQVFQVEDEDENLIKMSADEAQPKQVISLNVKKRSGENILDTANEINAVLSTFPLPVGTQVVITGDQSEGVKNMVKDLENNIISGLIFVVAVLLFFLGVRNAVLVGIAIPLSMFISFIILQMLGYTLNFVILFSLIIALGMLVDNAVVIVENIYRFREEGYAKFEAARLATAEVAGPVVASTATTVAAFAPMLFWPGIMGEFMSYLPLTLIITLSSSLFVALIINPVITGMFVRLESEGKGEKTKLLQYSIRIGVVLLAIIIGLANYKSLIVLAVATVLLIFLHRNFFKPIGDHFVAKSLPNLITRYRTFLRWMLKRDYAAKHAMLRNTFSLGAFTGGVILLILSAVVGSALGSASSMILLVPGVVLFAAGLIGILVHTFETIFLGRAGSVKFGIGFGIATIVILVLMSLTARSVDVTTIANLLILPIIITAFGALGLVFKRRDSLVLTDNRAKLLTSALGGLVGIMVMFAVAYPGTELFPDTDPNMIMVSIEGDLGTNIDESNRIALVAQNRLNELLEEDTVAKSSLKNIQTGVGTGGDILFGGGAGSPERSSVTLNLVDYADRQESSKLVMSRIRERLQGIPGTSLEFTKDNPGPPVGAPVNIEITGDDFSVIERITRDVRSSLVAASESGEIPGLVDVNDNLNTGRPELKVRINREAAARAGLNTSQIASTIRSGINGIEASTFRDGDEEYDITVRLSEADRASLESLRNLTVLYEGDQIPVASIAEFELGSGLGSVTRLDLNRVATVTGDVAPGFNSQQVLGEVQLFLSDYENTLAPGYTLSYTGESEEQQEAFGFLTNVLLIAIALIFMIMVAQFNKVSMPFIIMVAVGLSLIGVLLGLILTRTPFGLMTFIGVISLAGIVVNNNIVLVDYIIQLRERGLSKIDAIIEGGATRLRPVVLTALTTVIGLIPLTLGIGIDFVGLIADMRPNFQFGSENTQFWGPMGTAIIAGLTFATFLTLVIVPVMYSVFDSLSLRLATVIANNKVPSQRETDIHSAATPAGALDGNGSTTSERAEISIAD